MSFTSHTKVRILLSLLVILTIVSAFTISIVSRGSSHASGPAATTYKGVASTVIRSAASKFALHSTAQPSVGRTRVVPVFHKQSASNAASAVGKNAPHVADSGGGNGGSSLLRNFNGLNSVDSFNVNGFILEPPDQGLCVGSLLGSKVTTEIINDVVAFYRPNGTLFGPQENLNVFFGEPTALNTSDPRCLYDPTTQSWFFSVVVYTNTLFPNHTDLLVLQPNLFTAVYRIDTTLPNNTAGGCPCFGDQPKLGIDKNNVYISVDQFGSSASLETGADLFALSKSQLVAGASTVNIAEFLNLSLAGIGITALQPAITNSNSNNEYLLNSFPYADEAQLMPNTISKLLGLWALSNTAAVTGGGVPTLSATLITSQIYGAPVPALTTNGLSLATFTNDSRMQQVQFINGQLWGALDTAVAIGNDPVTRDGAAWFEIQPKVSNGTLTGANFTDQGYIAVAGKYLVYPAITTTYKGTTGISFSITSPTLNPSTGFVVRKSGSANFGGANITSLGSGPDIGFTCALGFPQQCRWGDYSWSTLDPNGQDLWMAAEKTVKQVATQPGITPPAQTNWGTQVWEVMGN
jgi:hypothetical protein